MQSIGHRRSSAECRFIERSNNQKYIVHIVRAFFNSDGSDISAAAVMAAWILFSKAPDKWISITKCSVDR